MAYNNVNPQSSGQQFFIPGSQAAFTPCDEDFPPLGSEDLQNNAANSQQQVSSGEMTTTVNDDLFANFSKLDPHTTKVFDPTKEEEEENEAKEKELFKAAIEALPTKGKHVSFFWHQGENVSPNMEQMQFIWAYYPMHSGNPHEILNWLITEAQRIALEE